MFLNNNSTNKVIICFCLFISILFFNVVSVLAATPGNQNNYYDNIYSVTQYTNISDLLNDSGYAPSEDFVNNFLSSKDYENKYIISYCNSSNCEITADSRSIGFIGFNNDVSAKFTQLGRELKVKFSGDPNSMIYIYRKDNFIEDSAEHSLSFLNYSTTFSNIRSVLPVSSITNTKQLLPSLLFDAAFKDLYKDIKTTIISHIDLIAPFILILFFTPYLIYIFKRIRRFSK